MEALLPILKEMSPGGYGIWLGVFMFAGYLFKEWRETRKLSNEDRLARRDGYAKQVENLQRENRELRGDMDKLEKKHTEYRDWCEAQHDKDRNMIRSLREESEAQRDQDRGMIRALQDELTGIKRAMAAGQVAVMETLPPTIVSSTIKAMAQRTGEHIKAAQVKRDLENE